MLFQNILHVFTDRPDLCVRSYAREFRQAEKERGPVNTQGWAPLGMDAALLARTQGHRSPEWVVEYGRAVSRISDYRWYAMDYEAAEMSKHRKAPVLVAEYGWNTAEDERVFMEQRRREFPGLEQFPETYTPQARELLTLTWGADGKCICQIELEREGGALKEPKIVGVDALMGRLGGMFSRPSFWDGLPDRPLPAIAEELGQELGIFVCGPGLEAFVTGNCELRREMRLGKFYRFRGENQEGSL